MLKKCILWFFVIVVSIQIFSFSGENGQTSDGTSKKVTAAVVEIVKKTCDIPQQEERSLFEFCNKVVRKTAHFSEFMLLAMFTAALCRSYRLNMRFSVLISSLYCLLFGTADEIHQLFVDGRTGRVTDVIIDFSGALAGVVLFVLCRMLYQYFCRKKSN